jgi:AsmA family protein
MDWRKAAVVSAILVGLLVAAAALALHALVDPQRLKSAARDRALAAWERELLMGDVELTLFPRPSLRAAKVAVANPSWAREPHLLQADVVRADLELVPLLTGKVRIKSLAMDGVKAALEVADDGAVSWELKPAAEPKKPPPAEADVSDALQIATVEIRNARIVHREGREPSEPWLVEAARMESAPGHRNVRVEARLKRHGRALHVKARLEDLSALGDKGAATAGEALFDWGDARLEAKGRLPLDKSLAGMDVDAVLEAKSLQGLLAFFGFERGKTAPVHVKLKAVEDGGHVALRGIAAKLGALAVSGDGRISTGDRKKVHANLQAERLDWLKALADAGGTIRPKRRDGQIFHADPVAWRALGVIGGMEGSADLRIGTLRLGNGIELGKVKTKMTFGNGRLTLKPFAAEMLGGSGQGSLAFDSGKKSVRFELDGENLLLERWFRERGSKVPFTGGPMKASARLALAGATYRELASSVTGNVRLRMGKGVWDSKRVGEAEEVMVRALHPREDQAMELQCAAADLEFRNGRASGKDIVGARSDVSQLLTSGSVDLKEETLDLRGKVYARSGSRIGLASIASEVQVGGRLAKPTMQLDPDARPAVIARAGAAIATAGASLLGSAVVDAVEAKNNPCEIVFK